MAFTPDVWVLTCLMSPPLLFARMRFVGGLNPAPTNKFVEIRPPDESSTADRRDDKSLAARLPKGCFTETAELLELC
jgi:hypothetical protein